MKNNLPQLDKIMNLLQDKDLRVINLGLELFAETYQNQGVSVVHVLWQPPAGGDPDLAAMLADLDG